jgi:peroxiredoxin
VSDPEPPDRPPEPSEPSAPSEPSEPPERPAPHAPHAPPEPPEPPERLTRLDPDAAATGQRAAVEPEPAPRPRDDVAPAPVIDTRPYRWAVGIIGLLVVLGVGTYQFATHGRATTGVVPGARLHWFAAPLADSDLRGDANLRPTCRAADHDPRALNLCLDAHRSAVVLSLFVTDSAQCVHQVDALQSLSRRFAGSHVQFLAVAVHGSHAATARLVRSHHWTIPVAYDPDGAVGEQYGVVICPMAELATRGGIVRDRLIGDRWQTSAALQARVAALVDGRAGFG